MNTIKFKSSIYNIEMTEEEVAQLFDEHQLLIDAVIYIINPKLMDKSWDGYFSSLDKAIAFVREILSKGDYNEIFINNLFKNYTDGTHTPNVKRLRLKNNFKNE